MAAILLYQVSPMDFELVFISFSLSLYFFYFFFMLRVLDSCIDRNGNCPAWKQSGACQTDPDIMKDWCLHSCDLCNGEKHLFFGTVTSSLVFSVKSTGTLSCQVSIGSGSLGGDD